jgi:hypothetical protein
LPVILALGLAFSTKLTTPLTLIPLFFLLELKKNQGLIRVIYRTLLVAISGICFYLAWWIPLARIGKLDWEEPFKFTFQSATGRSNHATILETLRSALLMPKSAMAWLGPVTLFIALIFVIKLVFSKFGILKNYLIIIFCDAILIWMTYDEITGAPFGFPKYWNIPLILISLFLGTLLPDLKVQRRKNRAILFLTFLGLAAITKGLFTHQAFKLTATTLPIVEPIIFFIIVVPILFAIIKSLKEMNIWASLCFSMLVIWTAQNVSVNIWLSQQRASIRYYFGESGQAEVLKWLSRNTTDQDILFSAKDIGLQSGRKFYEDAYLLGSLTPSSLSKFLLNSHVDIIVIRNKWDYSPLIYSQYFSALTNSYALAPDGAIGDFQIWRKIK